MSKNEGHQTRKPEENKNIRPTTEQGHLSVKEREQLFLTHEYAKRRFEQSKDNDGFLENMLARARELTSTGNKALPTLLGYLHETWPESQYEERAPFLLLNYIATYHELGIASYRLLGVEDFSNRLSNSELNRRLKMKDEEFEDCLKEPTEKFDKDDLARLRGLSIKYWINPASLLAPVSIKEFLAEWPSKNEIFSLAIAHERRAPYLLMNEGNKDNEKFITLKIPRTVSRQNLGRDLQEAAKEISRLGRLIPSAIDNFSKIKNFENCLAVRGPDPFRHTKDSFRNRLAGLYVYDLFLQKGMPKKPLLKEIRKNMSEILCSKGENGQNCNECSPQKRYSCADKLNKEFCKAFTFITEMKDIDLNFNKIQQKHIRHIERINYYDFWQGKPRS